jgi:hypothetical protein
MTASDLATTTFRRKGSARGIRPCVAAADLRVGSTLSWQVTQAHASSACLHCPATAETSQAAVLTGSTTLSRTWQWGDPP